jgi:hypothetical protein
MSNDLLPGGSSLPPAAHLRTGRSRCTYGRCGGAILPLCQKPLGKGEAGEGDLEPFTAGEALRHGAKLGVRAKPVTERRRHFRSLSRLRRSSPLVRSLLTAGDMTIQPGVHWTLADIDAVAEDWD